MVRDQTRTRDPHRRDRILDSAVELFSTKGYHAVSIADIGDAAGITGSGIYRHFESKSAILVDIFEGAIDKLNLDQETLVHAPGLPREILLSLIDRQVDFVVDQRALAQVYFSEIQSLPSEDQVRLRRKQRLYLEEWVHLLIEARTNLSDAHARTLVHAAVGAIQSALFFRVGLDAESLRATLQEAARLLLFDIDEPEITAEDVATSAASA